MRYLNKIIFINSAHVPYAEIKLDGNVHFNMLSVEQVSVLTDRIVRRYEPVYATPTSTIGRAPLFAAYKQLGHRLIPTLWFNTAMLWLSTLLLYIALCCKLPERIGRMFKGLGKRKRARK